MAAKSNTDSAGGGGRIEDYPLLREFRERIAASAPAAAPSEIQAPITTTPAQRNVEAFSYQAPAFRGQSRPNYRIPQVPNFYVSPFYYPSGEDVFEDPSYQFRLNEGLKALERSAAARGTLRSGNTLQELMRYGQDYASQEYGNAAQRAAQQYGVNFGASQAMYAPYFAQWQAQSDLAKQAEDAAYQRQWDAYRFGLDDEFRREEMLYRGGLGTY